jgi:hypothetical protein
MEDTIHTTDQTGKNFYHGTQYDKKKQYKKHNHKNTAKKKKSKIKSERKNPPAFITAQRFRLSL